MSNENVGDIEVAQRGFSTCVGMNPQTLLLFSNPVEARSYRQKHGTGGWIFTNEDMTVLFPPDVTPSGIFNHPVTRSRHGQLIGSQ